MESLVSVLVLAASFGFALLLARAFLESVVRLSRLGEDVDRNSFHGTARGGVPEGIVAYGPIAS